MFSGYIKQSTARNVLVLMIDSSDHITGKASLTLTITASKDGAAFGSISPTVTDRGSGWYNLALTTGHTDTIGDLALHITATGADPADYRLIVTARLFDDLAFPATSGRSIVVDAAGLVDANTVKQGPSGSGVAQTARDMGASVLVSSGTGTGQLDVTAGIVKSNLTQILGTTLTEGAAGRLAAGIKQFFNVASPAATMDHGVLVDTVTTLTNYTAPPSAASIASTVMASVIEGAYTLTQWLRLMGSPIFGKADGLAGTTVHYRDTGDSKNRITATVDADGNRTAVTLDAS